MKPSTLVKTIQDRLIGLASITDDSDLEFSKEDLAIIRRTLGLTWFNIVKYDSLLFDDLSDLTRKVPLESWPFKNLPSAKLNSKFQRFLIV